MPDPVNLSELRALDQKEAEVLYHKAKGKDSVQISSAANLSVSTVNTYATHAYKKLPQIEPDEKDKHAAFMRIYSQEMIYLWDVEKYWEGRIASSPTSKPKLEGVKKEKEETPATNKNLPAEGHTEAVRPSFLTGVIIGILLSALVLGGGFLLLRSLGMGTAGAAEPTQALAQEMATNTTPPENRDTVIPGTPPPVAVIPTDTASAPVISTNTAEQPTAIPTDTALPPQQPFTFEEHFDNPLDPTVWDIEGDLTTSGGYLVALKPGWIFVGEDTWQNYEIEVLVENSNCVQSNYFFTGVRVQDGNNMMKFQKNFCASNWARVVKGKDLWIASTKIRPDRSEGPAIIRVEGQTYSWVGMTEFADNTYTHGKVGIYLSRDAKVDYIKITSLP